VIGLKEMIKEINNSIVCQNELSMSKKTNVDDKKDSNKRESEIFFSRDFGRSSPNQIVKQKLRDEYDKTKIENAYSDGSNVFDTLPIADKTLENDIVATECQNKSESANESKLNCTPNEERHRLLQKTLAEKVKILKTPPSYNTMTPKDSQRQEKIQKKFTLNQSYTSFTNCIINYMVSSQLFYVQMENFNEELHPILNGINSCTDSFSPVLLTKGSLCIGRSELDGLFYRCRVVSVSFELKEAECLLMDFGETDKIKFDEIKIMNKSLQAIRPLAIRCKLENYLLPDSIEFQRMKNLVFRDTRFNIRIRTSDLENALEDSDSSILIDLCVSQTNVMVNEANLKNDALWD
jgi:hypothetical protein